MSKFNLEKALRGEPIQTSDGRKLLMVENVYMVTDSDGDCVLIDQEGEPCERNVIGTLTAPVVMAPRKVTVWTRNAKAKDGTGFYSIADEDQESKFLSDEWFGRDGSGYEWLGPAFPTEYEVDE